MFLTALDASFLVAVETVLHILEGIKPLSVQLQGKYQDIYRASRSIQDYT